MARPISPVPHLVDRSSSARANAKSGPAKRSKLTSSPRLFSKERRDTAEGCRERAAADLLKAATMGTEHGRQMLERSASSWSLRAEALLSVATVRSVSLQSVQLTAAEIAEDADHSRTRMGFVL